MRDNYTIITRHLILMTLALLLLSLTGLAIAKPDKPPCHPHCDDPEEPPSIVSNQANWGGLFEEAPRFPCTTSGGTPTGSHGSYGCPVADEMYPVNYKLQNGAPSKKKDDATYCEGDSFVGDKFPDYRYVYAWEGPCEGDSCEASVINTFFGYDNHLIPNVGLVHLVATGYIEGPFDNLNPFAEEREITVQEIDVTFYASGNDRKLATCHWEFYDEEDLDLPVLHTEPRQ